ncbi:MAG: 50S ribosomal protein L5 [Candidatus Hydrogenedentes bacterium]|nr:50S ribosomal protein L5 [Candidatus Hydrogenedentota bacterium]
MVPRLKEKYLTEVRPQIMKQFGITNVNAAPRIDKIVTNIGVGEAQREPQQIEIAAEKLAAITGQKAKITRARKSISGFKLREGSIVGCTVTLRGARMYEFFDRLFNVAVPRVRDFRGLSPNAFDGGGNYTLGLRDITIFPEAGHSGDFVPGMNVTIVISNSKSAEQSREMLRQMGVPFSA